MYTPAFVSLIVTGKDADWQFTFSGFQPKQRDSPQAAS
jgi:hypothetical protein